MKIWDRSTRDKQPRYVRLVIEELGLPREFLSQHAATIRARLLGAGDLLVRTAAGTAGRLDDGGDALGPHQAQLLAVNQAMHLASGVLLLGVAADQYQRVAEQVCHEHPFAGCPTDMVLTIAVLCFLLDQVEAGLGRHGASDAQAQMKLDRLRESLDGLYWMTSAHVMHALGIVAASALPVPSV